MYIFTCENTFEYDGIVYIMHEREALRNEPWMC